MESIGPYMKKKYPEIYYFLTGIVKTYKNIVSPYSIYITDSLGGSFKNYFISTDMNRKISDLKRYLDKESIDTINVIVQRLLNYPDERYKHKISRHKEVVGGFLPVETKQIIRHIDKKLTIYRRILKFPSKHINESVFYYYHGLSLLPDDIKKYIRDHDFIDAGAFIGDSALALMDYNYKKIYSIEMSHKSIERYKVNLANCNVSPEKYEIINAGIVSTDNKEPVTINDTGSTGLSLLRKAGKYDKIRVMQMTLDKIVNEYKISPRFIKVDIEGNSLDFVKGANETLKKYRPVLSMAIYHNPYEFFEVKPLLEELLNNYMFMVRKLTSGVRNNLCHSEVMLIGYPEEIIE